MSRPPSGKDPMELQVARTTRYRSKGRFVGVLVRNGEPLEALEALEAEHGSLAAAVNAALLESHQLRQKAKPAPARRPKL